MRKGLGLGLFGAFLAAMVAPQLAKADPQIPADGLAEGSGHWVTGRYDLSCKSENRLFVDATVHTRIVDGSGKEDCKGERLEISNRASKPFHYGIAGSVIATVASGGVVTIFVPRPSDPEADTRIPLTGRHFSDCGVGKMWKNGTCKDWEDPCPAGESRADIIDLWQAQGEDYELSTSQWRIGNECYDDKGKFDSDDAECKAEVKRCEDQRSKISSNQHDHSTVHDAALSDMRKPYLGQTYTIRDQKIFEETDASISCGYTSRETIFKRSKDRQAIGERHWRVANEYSNWLIWKQQVNRECSIKNNQAPKQIATFTPRKYQEPTHGPASGRKHGTTNPTPDATRSNGQLLEKRDDKDREERERHRHTFEHQNQPPPMKAQPLEQHPNKGTTPPTQSQSQPLQKNDPSRPQPPTSTNTPPPREGGHEQHQNAPKLPGQPLDQSLGKTGPHANAPLTPNGPNGTRPVPLGVQANPTNPTNPSTSTPSRTNPPTIADLGKKLEEERREREQREQAQRHNQLQARERVDADRQRAERERNEREQREQRERLNHQSQQNDRMRADRERNEREQRERLNQQSQNDRMRADRERADRERADRERNERASREADQRRDEQRRQLEQQQRQAQEDRRRQQQEESRRQQQEESRRQQQEEARRQRDEERRRQAQEESRRQQEEQRRQSQQRMQPSTSFGRRR